MNLLTLRECIEGEGDIFQNREVKRVCLDSRMIGAGDVFLTIGHGKEYIEDAIEKGAIAIITEEDITFPNISILRVSSTLESLGKIAAYQRKNYHGKVIAITGSNGKTTTKELLKFLLSFHYHVLANKESENNHIGVPKTLLQLDDSYDYVILEMGMNHKGEIAYLSHIAQPDIGIITNIGTAHIGYLGSQEEIFKAKMELLEGNPHMELFVNGEDSYLEKVPAHKVYAKYTHPSIPSIDVSLAIKVCEYLGCHKEELLEHLKSFTGVKSRMQKIVMQGKTIIDDAYNASLESIAYGLEELSKWEGRKIVIIGDVLELGDYSEKIHEKIGVILKEYPQFLIWTVGDEMKKVKDFPHFDTLLELKTYFQNFSFQEGDVIYLKSSHRIGLSNFANFLKKLFS